MPKSKESGSYGAPEFDPEDYDTAEGIAEAAAPIYQLQGWTWRSGVPGATEIAERIEELYSKMREDNLTSISTGRLIIVDENPHDGTPVLHEGIRVLLDLGELPPIHGDLRGEANSE